MRCDFDGKSLDKAVRGGCTAAHQGGAILIAPVRLSLGSLERGGGFSDCLSGLCTMDIVHACTMAIVHSYTMTIVLFCRGSGGRTPRFRRGSGGRSPRVCRGSRGRSLAVLQGVQGAQPPGIAGVPGGPAPRNCRGSGGRSLPVLQGGLEGRQAPQLSQISRK